MNQSARRALIVRLSAMGDTVCTLPCASAIKKSDPDCHVTWVVDSRFASIVRMCSDVDEVVELSKKTPILEQKRVIENLGEFDFSFDMQGLLKSAILVGASKAKQKLGFHWQREGARLFSSPVAPDRTSLHVVDQYLDVVRYAGFEADKATFNIVPPASAAARIQEILSEEGVRNDYAVVQCGGGWIQKRWPEKDFADVCKNLIGRGITPVLIGAKAEIESTRSVMAMAPGSKNLVGKTNLDELTSLIQGARIYVGGDTGATHIAAALGVPCVGIYTVTDPSRSCPYGQFSHCPAPSLATVLDTVGKVIE